MPHPSDWSLEMYAEGELSPLERAPVAEHLEECARCVAEVEGYRALFAALEGLPRFAPAPDFNDAVIARVNLAPETDPLFVRVVRWLPTTTRGWVLLLLASLAPALPLIGLGIWILTQPLVSVGGLWQWATVWVQDAGWSLLTGALVLVIESQAMAWTRAGLDSLLAAPVQVLATGALILAVGIPLSAWTLYRLLRTPMGETRYAH